YRSGAFEYLPKPFDLNEAVALAERAMQRLEPVNDSTQAQFPELLGEAPAMQNVFRAIGRLSRSHINLLIRGESGTGKELVAQALHRNSPRAKRPLVAINTAAIPSELLESELFGHERGAFTGAQSQRKGRFEQAHSGTLFLDEIGDMPTALQSRLLRVLSEGRFYRVGGHDQIEVDVRVIAATHQNLEILVEQGKFREDLFHRLNVMQITLPSLRERREDIGTLAKQFLQEAAQELSVEPKSLEPRVLTLFQSYRWPGNVRELQNTCRRLTVMAPSQTITADDLSEELRNGENEVSDTSWQEQLRQVVRQQLERGDTEILTKLTAQFEKLLIKQALAHTGGHKQEAAKKLGLGRNTLTRKLKEFDDFS
ncbi:MAG: sigma 54-interacting transcriptional regulator, partial [Gammaproteobacteria bacterium]|nr:sigma 54-interacting transcriptional regulator [Gammaproteobacteria bacterium]